MELEALRYPVGKWVKPASYETSEINTWIEEIRSFPSHFCSPLQSLHESSFENRYRPEGWTLRQLTHHIADSHLNAYIRHKLAYTEDQPRISPYKEALWAELKDVHDVPVSHSLQLISDLHLRWSVFLSSIEEEALEKSFFHPEHDRLISIRESINMYAWHCRHHLAHAEAALKNPY